MAASGASFYFEMLRGATYTTVVDLGGGPLPGTAGTWTSYKAAVNVYAGESVKFRVRPQLGAVTVDNVALFEKALPGWSFTTNSDAAASGSDGNGNYATSWTSTGALQIASSPINVGFIDKPYRVDGRSYVVSYQIGYHTGSVIYVDWVPTTGSTVRVYQDAANSPTGYKNGRFTLNDTMATSGHFWINVTGGGRLYSIGDNIARQQLSEPFSQQVHLRPDATIDTSTGSFGTSVVDLTIEGGLMPIVLARYYRGHSARYGELGYRWTQTYDAFAATYANNDVAVVLGSGKEEYFAWSSSSSTWAPVDPRVTSTLTTVTDGSDVLYQYVTKDGIVYRFTTGFAGDLVSIRDRNGNQLTVYRDPSNGLVTSIEDDANHAITLTYDGNNRLATAADPTGLTATYGYDTNGDLVSVELDNGVDYPQRTEYAYSRHRLTTIKRRTGTDASDAVMTTVLTNVFDNVNRIVQETDDQGNSIAVAYQTPSTGVTRATDQLGHDTDFYFDTWARTVFVDRATDQDSVFVYDGSGYLSKLVNAAGGETDFAYDANANPTTLTDPLGNPSNITYNAQNLPTNYQDPNGNAWAFTYDSDANVLTQTNPLSKTWTFTYDDGNRTSETTPLGNLTIYAYDDGRLATKIVDPTNDLSGNPRGGTHLNLTWTYEYDDAGHKTSETNPRGYTTEWTWRGGNLAAMTNALGQTYGYGYDLLGEMTNASDPGGGTTVWAYIGSIGTPNVKVDALGKATLYTYDPTGRMTSEKDPTGLLTTYFYDADGRLVAKIVDPAKNLDGTTRTGTHFDLMTRYEYTAQGQLWKETVDPALDLAGAARGGTHLNRVTTTTYDGNGRVSGKELPNGGVWTYTYDDGGNVLTEEDPMSHTTTKAYDTVGRLALVIDANGNRTKYVYDDDNRQIAVVVDPATAPDGTPYSGTHLDLTSGTAYDAASRVASVTDPEGRKTAYGYDENGNRTSVTVDPNPTGGSGHLALTTAFAYDELDRLQQTTDPEGRTTTLSYDSRGRKVLEVRGTTATEPGIRTKWVYDAMGRVLQVVVDPATAPNGTAYSGSHKDLKTIYEYDDAGRQKKVTDPRGYDTQFHYDSAGRLHDIQDAKGGTVVFAYDNAGETTGITNPRGKVSSKTYDALGNVLTETDPLSRTYQYAYDAAGRRTQQTDPLTQVLYYSYDAGNRLLGIAPCTGSGCTTSYVTYTYDAANRQKTMADATGTTSWDYDDAGLVLSVASPQGTTAYTYDAAKRRETMTLPGSRTVSYDYDDANELETLTDWQSRATTFGYTGFGTLAAIVRPNGVSTSYAYDSAGRLDVIEHALGATLLARFDYAVDADGNRTDLVITGSAVANGTESYGYDELDRLTSWSTTVNGSGSASYAYDANGNRASVTSGGSVTTYNVDDADQLTSLSGAASLSFSYDANGNRTAAGSDSYGYDWRNRLTSATAGGATVTYTYAGDGTRATRTVAGSTTNYLWDRTTGLAELVDDGTTASLQLGNGTLAEIDNGTNAALYGLLDGQGTVRAETDGSGSATGSAAYDAWGNARGSVTTATSSGWTGEPRDPATGLTDLRSRDYDPARGRFTSRDTVHPNASGTQGYNAYAYAGNNPATLTDPSGHSVLGDLGASAGQGIAQLIGSVDTMVYLLTHLDALPPPARMFVTALLVFGLNMVRYVIVMVLLSLGMIVMGEIGGMVGEAFLLLEFMRAFKPMLDFYRKCPHDMAACISIPNGFPGKPDESLICQTTPICDFLSNFNPRSAIGVVGICVGGSAWTAPFATKLSFSTGLTYCELKDRTGQYGRSISWTVLSLGLLGRAAEFWGPSPKGGSIALSGLVGLFMDSIYDVAGWSPTIDYTNVNVLNGRDWNVTPSNTGVTVSGGTAVGDENSIEAGAARTWVWPMEGPGKLGLLVDMLAALVWDESQ